MSNYSFEKLIDKKIPELESIKKKLQQELYEVQQEKIILIRNIQSLEGLIENERKAFLCQACNDTGKIEDKFCSCDIGAVKLRDSKL